MTDKENGYQDLSLDELRERVVQCGRALDDRVLGGKRRNTRDAAAHQIKQYQRMATRWGRFWARFDSERLAYRWNTILQAVGDILRTIVVTFFVRIGLPLAPLLLFAADFLAAYSGLLLLTGARDATGVGLAHVVSTALSFVLVMTYFVLLFQLTAVIHAPGANVRYTRFSLVPALRRVGYVFGFRRNWQAENMNRADRIRAQLRSLMIVQIALTSVGRMQSLMSVKIGDLGASFWQEQTIAFLFDIIIVGPLLSVVLLGATHFVITYLASLEQEAATRRGKFAAAQTGIEIYTPDQLAAANEAERLFLIAWLTNQKRREIRQQLKMSQMTAAVPPARPATMQRNGNGS